MLPCKGSTSRQGLCYCWSVFQGRMYVTVERYFRVGSMLPGGRGQGQKVTAYVDVAGENLDCIGSRREPPGGTRVHEQCLSPHSCGEG